MTRWETSSHRSPGKSSRNPALLFYRLLGTGLHAPIAAFRKCLGRAAGLPAADFAQRLGRYSSNRLERRRGFPRIWLHAVSVGEVGVAGPIIEAILRRFPRCSLVLSSATRHGYRYACERLGSSMPILYSPLDTPPAVRSALRRVAPCALVFLETEIWPSWIFEAQRLGVRTAVINGRISERTLWRYERIRGLIASVLSGMDAFGMISDRDAHRIVQLGASPERVRVLGNAKFDIPDPPDAAAVLDRLKQRYGLSENPPVLVAGSTRGWEEKKVLEAFLQVRALFPDSFLILAPRHIQRAGEIRDWVQKQGVSCQLRTDLEKIPRTAPVVVVDTMGELRDTYSIATAVFCGGSLVPLGGQNMLEPALWEKPILCGPHTEDFRDEWNLLASAGGAVRVDTATALGREVASLFQDPSRAAGMGRRAREAVLSSRGAAERYARAVCRLVGERFTD